MANGWSMAWSGGAAEDSGRDDGEGSSMPQRPGAPDNEVPATLAIDRVLAATDDVVLYLAGMSVYSNGARFTLEVRARPGWRAGSDDRVWDAVHGHGRGADRLLLGVEYADGRRCATLEGPFGEGAGVSLMSGGSSGGGRSACVDWFLSPLPPPGEVRLYCAWPGAGIEESVTVLDGAVLLEAAGRVRELWPWEPERPEERGRAEPPVVRAGGWFASLNRT